MNKLHLDGLNDEDRLEEGEDEGGEPGRALLAAPLEAVEQREEASERHGEQDERPRHEHHPPDAVHRNGDYL